MRATSSGSDSAPHLEFDGSVAVSDETGEFGGGGGERLAFQVVAAGRVGEDLGPGAAENAKYRKVGCLALDVP